MLNKLLIILSLCYSSISAAQDCLVNTDLRPIEKYFTGIEQVKQDISTGKITISLESGEVIQASFGVCELSAHAYIQIPNGRSLEDYKATFTNLAHIFISSAETLEKSLETIKNSSLLDFNSTITITSATDKHEFTLKKSSSPLFDRTAIYAWVPPEH